MSECAIYDWSVDYMITCRNPIGSSPTHTRRRVSEIMRLTSDKLDWKQLEDRIRTRWTSAVKEVEVISIRPMRPPDNEFKENPWSK